MKYAIFSDIHNNDQALARVLQHAAERSIDRYLCLGDVGTDPSVTLVRNVGAETVFGNWEVSGWGYLSAKYQDHVLRWPPLRKYDGFWIGHASPNWPDNIDQLEQFLKNRHRMGLAAAFPYYIHQSEALWRAFATLLEAKISCFFHGHTHLQAVWTLTSDNCLRKTRPEILELSPEDTYIIGVGSVGQPRDSTQPSYVIYDTASAQVQFVSVDGDGPVK